MLVSTNQNFSALQSLHQLYRVYLEESIPAAESSQAPEDHI
jgi:TorA maturation chaperone TorD